MIFLMCVGFYDHSSAGTEQQECTAERRGCAPGYVLYTNGYSIYFYLGWEVSSG
jgi:hypothetical protein